MNMNIFPKESKMNANTQAQVTMNLPAPLTVARDMRARWDDTDCDFDTAAQSLVNAHANDGRLRDVPILDLRTWGLKSERGQFALAPLAGHEPARVLRANAFSQLANRLGMPVEFVRDKLCSSLQLGTVNFLLATAPSPMSAQLRFRGDEVSAIVSERYAPLDSTEFVDTLRQTLNQQGLLSSVRARAVASGTTDLLRLVIPSESQAIKVGDVTAVGLDLSRPASAARHCTSVVCFGASSVPMASGLPKASDNSRTVTWARPSAYAMDYARPSRLRLSTPVE